MPSSSLKKEEGNRVSGVKKMARSNVVLLLCFLLAFIALISAEVAANGVANHEAQTKQLKKEDFDESLYGGYHGRGGYYGGYPRGRGHYHGGYPRGGYPRGRGHYHGGYPRGGYHHHHRRGCRRCCGRLYRDGYCTRCCY